MINYIGHENESFAIEKNIFIIKSPPRHNTNSQVEIKLIFDWSMRTLIVCIDKRSVGFFVYQLYSTVKW